MDLAAKLLLDNCCDERYDEGVAHTAAACLLVGSESTRESSNRRITRRNHSWRLRHRQGVEIAQTNQFSATFTMLCVGVESSNESIRRKFERSTTDRNAWGMFETATAN